MTYNVLSGTLILYTTTTTTTAAAATATVCTATSTCLSVPRAWPRASIEQFGRFAVHGPVIWNHLPHDLRSTDISLTTFRKRLKTFLFDADT